MAHFALLDENNKVLNVIVVGNQNILDKDGNESEAVGKSWCEKFWFRRTGDVGFDWKQTSYNNNFRKQYAGLGFTYDATKDKFILPKPFTSWSLNSNDDWIAPITYPNVNEISSNPVSLSWDEDNQRWTAKDEGVWNNSTNSYDTEPQDFNWDASALAWVSA